MLTKTTNRLTPAILLLTSIATASPAAAQTITGSTNDTTLRNALVAIRNSNFTPALGAAFVIDGHVYFAVTGVRRNDLAASGVNLAQPDDQFPIGSVSKPLTGAAMARAVELGLMRWDTTLGQSLPELFPNDVTADRYAGNTITQLMSHTSGVWYAPQHQPSDDYLDFPFFTDKVRRLLYTGNAVSDPPVCDTEECSNYDGGAIMAASMFEESTGQDFAAFMQQRVFTPLGMTRTSAIVDFDTSIFTWSLAPRILPHAEIDGVLTPQAYKHGIRWMVGGVYASVIDLARFGYASMYSPAATTHLYGSSANRTLTTAIGRGDFSPGWNITSSDDGAGLELFHNGSFGQSYTVLRVWPNRRVAIVTATTSDNAAARAAQDAAERWIIDHLDQYGADAGTDQIDGAVPARATASTGAGAGLTVDGLYSTGWVTAGAGNSRLTLTPTVGATFPSFHRIFLDEGGKAFVPNFTKTSSRQSLGSGPMVMPISSATVWVRQAGFTLSTKIATVYRVGPRRFIDVPTQSNVDRVDILFAADAPIFLREAHLF